MCTTKCWPFGSFLWNQNGIRISFFLFSLLLYFLFNFFGCECENMFKHLLVINFNLNMALQTRQDSIFELILDYVIVDCFSLFTTHSWINSMGPRTFSSLQFGIYFLRIFNLEFINIYILDCFWLIYYYFGHMNIVNIEPILLLLFLGQVPLVLGF